MQASHFTKKQTQTQTPFTSTAKSILGNMFKSNKVCVSNETPPPLVEEPLVYNGDNTIVVANKSENLILIMRANANVLIEQNMLDKYAPIYKIPLNLRIVTPMSSYYAKVSTCMQLYFTMYNAVGKGFWLSYHGKPLPQNNTPLIDYNIHNGDTIILNFGLLGGTPASGADNTQPDEDYAQASALANLFKQITGYINKLNWINESVDGEWFIKTIENFSQIVVWSRKCTNINDFYMLFCLGYKLHTGKSSSIYINAKLERLFDSNVQSGDFGDVLQTLRSTFESATSLSENPVVAKLVKLYSSLLVHGYLEQFGIKLSDEEYSKFEIRALESQYRSKKSMWLIVVDVALTMCERLYEWKLTGDISSLIHSNVQYVAWSKEVDRILLLSTFTSNLEAHGTTYFSYIADLNAAIEKGEAYVKFSTRANGIEPMIVKKKVYSLSMIKTNEITRRAAQKERKAPFGVLIHGCSSVAKSTFTKMLFYYYGKLMKLDTADHFKYVRCPADKHWNNFDSSKWCIQMDDIAFLLPGSGEVDPTLMELLCVGNNVGFVPPQAALEDKGKTPVLARLLLATTNAKDLNAHEYFYCPLAVRRRLPFVVHVEPKPDFLHANQRFIEPSKMNGDPTEFPNYWIITVQKIIPVADGRRDRADLEVVARYTEVNEFLRDFAKNAIAHEEIQCKAMTCDSTMSRIEVCSICYYPKKNCICMTPQAVDVIESEAVPVSTVDTLSVIPQVQWQVTQTKKIPIGQSLWDLFEFCYTWYIEMCFRWTIISWWLRFKVVRRSINRWVIPRMADDAQIRFLGFMNGRSLGTSRWRVAVACLATLSFAMTMYYKFKTSPSKKDKVYKKGETCPHCNEEFHEDGISCKKVMEKYVKPTVKYEVQGNIYSTTEDQLEKETTQNVWYDKSVTLTQFDMPTSSCSLVGLDAPQLRDRFSNNCVNVIAHRAVAGVKMHRSIGGIMIKGHYCITNNHTFPQDVDTYRVQIIKGLVKDGITPNIEMTLHENDIIRMPGKDLCLFKISSLPPVKDITKFWATTKDVPGTKCVALRRTPMGAFDYEYIYKMMYVENVPVAELNGTLDVYTGTVNRITQKGDCGAMYLDITPRGPVIFGLHSLGHETQCGATAILACDLDELVTKHQLKFGGKFIVQGGGHPMFACSLRTKILTEPHPRSMMRYIPQGKLHIYGSFAGFRAKPKSSVTATPLCEKMLQHFDVPLKHGRPNMGGWDVWKKNVVKAIEPTINYDRAILKHCVDSFTTDILTGLPKGWEGQLVTLSDRATVNGLPGVKFIDRLNVNTSMGFPWSCTKKRFLDSAPDDIYPEGVNFTQEVWDRVEEINKCYAEGRRAYPVFTGHLKDESLPLEKVAAGKVRLFSGAPVDWTLVVRSKLLSFIRLVQKNKFVFEAGPGTVCQSSEWTKVYQYLTIHGADRMVAGDYAAFDKKMLADFILAAFEIIINILEKAGYDHEELLSIACIAEDIAFPVTEINGDLVELFGSNPSGHALTVIINSIVNSLYARYVFTVCCPKGTCEDFKKFVSLFTYGDDNIMGISKEAPWFNHTSLQDELAKIGVTYTMADKSSVSIPYINVKDASFLKRTWVYNDELKNYLCPIEEESIHKSLTMWVPSNTICATEQMVAVISGANTEYFFHGRETFEKHHIFFLEILQTEPYCHYVGKGTLPTWEQLVERYNTASGLTLTIGRVEDTSDGSICSSEAELD